MAHRWEGQKETGRCLTLSMGQTEMPLGVVHFFLFATQTWVALCILPASGHVRGRQVGDERRRLETLS